MDRRFAGFLMAILWLAASGPGCGGCGGRVPGADDLVADPGGVFDVPEDALAPDPGRPDPGADTGDAIPDAPRDPGPADVPPPADPGMDADADAPAPDAAPDVADPGPGDPGAPDPGPLTALQCLADQLPESGVPPVDYDRFAPVLGSHCKGTNHQDIRGVQRVVFAGDSITTGTPPTPTADWYRNRLADTLAQRFGLEAPGALWRNLNLVDGIALQRQSGDFWCCAKFGARTDDLTRDPHRQLVTCNPPDQRDRRTLVVMTVGGNDIFKWAQDMVDGVPIETLWGLAEKAVQDLENAVHWLVDDPATFPNGVYLVFANTFAFNDADSGYDLANCPGAEIISMNWALINADFQAMASWFTAQYMRIAVETGTDMVFFGEAACGHGYMRDQPSGRCYRGPGAELWLDVTCMHPGSAGHAGLYDLFLSVIDE
jgi:lysophospholipase L1-like esterase